VDSQYHVKLALYAEQHMLKSSENIGMSYLKSNQTLSLTYALAVLSKLKDLNKVMIVDSSEGCVGNHNQKNIIR
jgi:hypothetical protein